MRILRFGVQGYLVTSEYLYHLIVRLLCHRDSSIDFFFAFTVMVDEASKVNE